MKAAIVYWSQTGNTEKVALAIKEGLEKVGVDLVFRRIGDARDLDWYDYDLFCIGFPSYRWSPPKPVRDFLDAKYGEYSKQGRVKVDAPKVPGKNALIFCTYTGPHTGVNEVLPAAKHAGQYLEHLGFTVLDEWYVLGEFHGRDELNTMGRMGDVRGKPDEQDLAKIRQDVVRLLERL
jgi:flavodoxin